jgi:hypothetical protein
MSDEMEMDECCYVQIERADNGWVVKWTAMSKQKSKDPYSMGNRKEKKKIFLDSDEDSAFELFKSLKKKEKSGY